MAFIGNSCASAPPRSFIPLYLGIHRAWSSSGDQLDLKQPGAVAVAMARDAGSCFIAGHLASFVTRLCQRGIEFAADQFFDELADRARTSVSIGPNQLSKRSTASSVAGCGESDFVIRLQHFPSFRLQCLGNFLDIIYRDISLASLDRADISPVHSGHM